MERTKQREWIIKFTCGSYDNPSRETQIKAGWWDWFCRDTSLRNKTLKMGNIIRQIKDGGKVNTDKTYVFLKNNCDDFRICDIENGNVQFTITIDCCRDKSKNAVYGRTPDGQGHWETPLFETNSQRELIKWLNTPWSE